MAVDIEESNKDYTDVIETVKDQGLSNTEWKSTPEVYADTLADVKYEKSTWRYQLVPGVLDYLHKNDVVEREERHEGGKATHYWRLEE